MRDNNVRRADAVTALRHAVRTRVGCGAVLAVTTLLGAWECGGSSPPPTTRDTSAREAGVDVELVALPRAAIKRCAELRPRRDVPILCPTRLPEGRWRLRYQSLEHNRRAYLPDFRPPGAAGTGVAHHVLAGGRKGNFPMRTRRGKWPPSLPLTRDLQLVGTTEGRRKGNLKPLRLDVVRRSRVADRPALIVRAADFPDGGIHGGHLGVVWNQRKNGYALTIHFSADSHLEPAVKEELLLEAAVNMSRFSAGN